MEVGVLGVVVVPWLITRQVVNRVRMIFGLPDWRLTPAGLRIEQELEDLRAWVDEVEEEDARARELEERRPERVTG